MKKKPDYHGGNQGGEDDIENRGGNLIPGQKKLSKPAVKKTRKVGSKKSRRVSQAPTRNTSADALFASSESEYENKSESESESESERDDERRGGRRASASQGGNNKKASDYAKGTTPRENEGHRIVGTRNSGAQEQGSDG